MNIFTRYIRTATPEKRFWLTVSASVVLSTLCFALFRYLEPPRRFVLQDDNGKAMGTSLSDLMLSGKLQRTFLSAAPTNFIAAAEAITPSVVNIKALTGGDDIWNYGEGVLGASSGSGVIISPDGYIITNNHVVEGASDIQVTLNDRRDFAAKIVGTDPSTDLALIKIDVTDKLKPVRFGNSDSIRVGEWVLAVGNPFNLESTVTAGIVSAKGRSINVLEGQTSIESFIQTDAAVNPGNSGGALVNTNGELVGINTAIITKTGRYEGYSFAIPVNLAMKVIADIKEYGSVQRGYLGVLVEDLSPEKIRDLGLKNVEGVVVSTLIQGSASADAGIRQGDIITAIGNTKTRRKSELLETVARSRPGSTLVVEFIRDKKAFKVNVTLRNKANTTDIIESNISEQFRKVGILELRPLNQQELQKTGSKGLKVISVEKGSRIDRANLEAGFIITHINDKKVDTIEEANRLIAKITGKVTLEGVYENFKEPYYYTFVK